ncbi:MAG: hypothetical protein AABX00_05875 [Nanoarchaeota archaeon]
MKDWDKLLKKIEERNNPNEQFKHVIGVSKLMIKDNNSFDVALYKIAQENGRKESTIRAACTRELKINTIEFKRLVGYPEELVRFLIEKFPTRQKEIEDALN